MMDSMKLIQDFLSFNGRLDRQDFIKRYLVVYLIKYGLFYLGYYFGMPLVTAASAVFIIPQMSLAVRRCHDIGLNWPKTIVVLVSLPIQLVSLISLVFLCYAKSDPYRNRFG